MGATLYDPAVELSLISTITNETYNDSSYESHSNSIDHPIQLFVLIAMWIILLVTIIFGTVGNTLVLYVYINRKDNKTCTFFIKTLAVIDLTICLVLAPLELYYVTAGIRNELLCKFYGFLSTHVLYSTFLITTIAFDRYFCICWPLYKIITIRRARMIVILCGLLSSLLAIIPMSEYSTMEHVLRIHDNHSEQFAINPNDGYDQPIYQHVEHIKTSASLMPFTLLNETDVSCSPKYIFNPRLIRLIHAYRMFHSAVFALCILLVFLLYAFIYNAVYQRRVTRTRKLSAYRRIIRTYLLNDGVENRETQSSKHHHRHHHHHHRRHQQLPSTLTLICCYCCKTTDEYMHELQNPSEAASHEPLSERRQPHHHHHHHQIHDELSSIVTRPNPNRPQVVLEVNGARGKRYSAISMTSMTYLTSGVWDETSPTSLIRSRINSVAATTYCGTEHSSTSRPSTSTEDSFEQTSKLLTLNSTLLQLRPMTPSSSTHLTVPGQQTTTTTNSTVTPTDETIPKDNQMNENALPRSVSQITNLLHPSIVRKTSNTLSIRQQRPSDASVHQRKVSFMTSAGAVDRCISEDPPSTYQRSSLAPPDSSLTLSQPQQQHHQLSVHMNNQRSLSTTSSIDNTRSSIRNFSVSSARRPSVFDSETQRILERQQTQERLANIRTTFTLFVVTATFITMYLPSIIHTLFNIKPHNFREIFFLLCYINSACNPLIYSFFNVNFRNDIRRIYECQKREYFARQY